MFDMMKIAKMVKRARIRKNMTQMDLANEMGVSYQAVSNWEQVQSEKAKKRLNLSAIVGMAVSGSGNTSKGCTVSDADFGFRGLMHKIRRPFDGCS